MRRIVLVLALGAVMLVASAAPALAQPVEAIPGFRVFFFGTPGEALQSSGAIEQSPALSENAIGTPVIRTDAPSAGRPFGLNPQ